MVRSTTLTSQIHLPLRENGGERICAKFTGGAVSTEPSLSCRVAKAECREGGSVSVCSAVRISPERNESVCSRWHVTIIKDSRLFTKPAADWKSEKQSLPQQAGSIST